MKLIPHKSRMLFLAAAFFMLLPSLLERYDGHTGRILVASPDIVEEPFRESVIYLKTHGFYQAQGFIVNKKKPAARDGGDERFYGGPVAYPALLSVMDRYSDGGIGVRSVLSPPGGSVQDSLMLEGYAGWTLMQLNREIMKGYWDVIDYDPALVFETPPEKMWSKARARVLKDKPVSTKGVL